MVVISTTGTVVSIILGFMLNLVTSLPLRAILSLLKLILGAQLFTRIFVEEVWITKDIYAHYAVIPDGKDHIVALLIAQLKSANYARLRVGIKPVDEQRSLGGRLNA